MESRGRGRGRQRRAVGRAVGPLLFFSPGDNEGAILDRAGCRQPPSSFGDMVPQIDYSLYLVTGRELLPEGKVRPDTRHGQPCHRLASC